MGSTPEGERGRLRQPNAPFMQESSFFHEYLTKDDSRLAQEEGMVAPAFVSAVVLAGLAPVQIGPDPLPPPRSIQGQLFREFAVETRRVLGNTRRMHVTLI